MFQFKNIFKPLYLSIEFFQKVSIRHKITLAVVVLILLPMALAGFYFYLSIASVLTRDANDNLTQLINQTNNIENSFKIIDTTSLHFLSNKTVRSLSLGDISLDGDFYKLFINKSQIEEDLNYSLMFNNAWDMNLISTAYVFLNEDTFCHVLKSQPNIKVVTGNNIAVYKKINGSKIRGKEIIPPSTTDRTIYFTRIVSSINNPQQRLVMIFGTDENELFKKYSELLTYPGSMIYITDDHGVIYSSSDRNSIGGSVEPSILSLKDKLGVSEVSLDGTPYFVASTRIEDTGLNFIAGIPKNQVLAKLSKSMRNYFGIILLIVLASIIAGIIISLRFTRFIRDLLNIINKVKVGNYEAKMPKYKDMELRLLSNTFNNMTDEIKYLINQVYEKQLLLKDTEFKFLQSQMNPHFLFNTLITIGYKARLSEDETIYPMVTALTELLQAGIYTSSQAKIQIRQELEFIKFYLYLQKVRFEDKLEYEINVSDDSILNFVIPKLSIEPIVENAVVHGLENKIGKGTVQLNIRQENASIYFEVIDDGTGFDVGSISLEDNETTLRRKNGHNNIGLISTHKRIRLIYGEPYGIHIESKINQGSRVIVHIPLDRSEVVNV